jgi:putative ABC transport system permease protein
MLAVIALLTGGFLVFSTQLLAVVRRRQELAFLRALGVDRPMLLRGLLAEAAAVGLVGGLLGLALGYGLAAIAFKLVGADLGAGYFEGVAPQLRFDPLASAGYLLLGVAAGVAGGYLPAREATRLQPARALRAGDEADLRQARPRWVAALACVVAGALAYLMPPVGGVPVFGYAAVALVLAGSVLALPGAARLARAPGRRPAGACCVWPRAPCRRPGQTVVAGAGVVASVASRWRWRSW